jgi:hypothetical protein
MRAATLNSPSEYLKMRESEERRGAFDILLGCGSLIKYSKFINNHTEDPRIADLLICGPLQAAHASCLNIEA